MENQTYNEESRGVAMNIFAVLGFIAILLAGLWATVQLVKQISNLSFDFNKPSINMPMFGNDDELTIMTDTRTFRSGENAQIKWTLGKDLAIAEGSTLSFSYACKAGAYIKVEETTTGTYRAIPCNAPYSIPTTSTELSIIPVLTNIKSGDLAYSLAYTPATDSDIKPMTKSDTIAISQTTTMTTVPTTSKTSVSTPMTEAKDGATGERTVVTSPAKKPVVKTYVPVRNSNPNGLPDLIVTILEVQPTNIDSKVSVKFEVANLGTKLADNWTFTATLPTEPAYTYVSEAQGALYAGERAEMLMTFDKLKAGSNSLLITVDAQNSIAESLETNNSVTQTIVGK